MKTDPNGLPLHTKRPVPDTDRFICDECSYAAHDYVEWPCAGVSEDTLHKVVLAAMSDHFQADWQNTSGPRPGYIFGPLVDAVRDLHKPQPIDYGRTVLRMDCYECDDLWPCDTAKLVYSPAEIVGLSLPVEQEQGVVQQP